MKFSDCISFLQCFRDDKPILEIKKTSCYNCNCCNYKEKKYYFYLYKTKTFEYLKKINIFKN